MRSLSRFVRLSLLLSTLVAAAAVPQAAFIKEARADSSEKKKVAVGAFEGAKSDEARSAFIEALKKDGGYEVTDAEDVKHSAKDKAIVEAAKGLAVNVVITGKVTKFNLKLKVRDGSTGKTLDQVDIKGGTLPKLKTNIEKTGASSVEGPVGQAKGAKVEEKKKEEAKPAEDAPKEEEKPAEDAPAADSGPSEAGALSPLEIKAGLRPYHRTFAFHQTLADVRPNDGFFQLLKYELPLGPALFIDLNLFPGSFVAKGPAEWIGLTGGFEKGFATQSVFLENKPGEKTLKTDMQQWFVGALFRFPIAAHQLQASAVYGQHTFELKGDEGGALVPDVKYAYVRPQLGLELAFGDFMAGAHVGKRFVLSTGALEDVWFDKTKATSLEAGFTVGYKLVSMLDLVAGFDWLRYAFDFNPVTPPCSKPGVAMPCTLYSYVAGGAVDEYFSGHIAFRFHLPGGGESGAAASASSN